MASLSSMSSGVWGLMLGIVGAGLGTHTSVFDSKGGWREVRKRPHAGLLDQAWGFTHMLASQQAEEYPRPALVSED